MAHSSQRLPVHYCMFPSLFHGPVKHLVSTETWGMPCSRYWEFNHCKKKTKLKKNFHNLAIPSISSSRPTLFLRDTLSSSLWQFSSWGWETDDLKPTTYSGRCWKYPVIFTNMSQAPSYCKLCVNIYLEYCRIFRTKSRGLSGVFLRALLLLFFTIGKIINADN